MNISFIQIVDTAVANAYQRGGHHLLCRPGCTQCCHGVFPISQQDAARLREALHTLEQTDSEKSRRIQSRASDARTRLTPLYPGDPATGILAQDYEDSPLFIDEDSIGDTEPCPVLDPATGTCDLYSARPIVCRTFGPPMRTPEGHLATCELCFPDATTEEIAACELDSAIPVLEQHSNAAFDAAHHTQGQTIIAFALNELAPTPNPLPPAKP